MNSLHRRAKMALASMNNKEVISKMIVDKCVKKYFFVIMRVEDIIHPKPDPEIFLKCSKKLECPPRGCVVIEDSLFGVEAAKEAGMKCIVIPTGAYSKKELKESDPDSIVNSLNEKQKIYSFIFQRQAQ